MSEAASCSGSPGRRSGGARAHRWVHRLATAVGAFAAALFLVAAAGLWRLTQGPISLDLVTPYIQEALNRSDRGPRIAVSGGRIGIDRQTHQLNLWMEGVRLTQSDGEPLAVFPAVSAAFGLRSFLHGTLAPTRLVIERPVLRLVRNETGTIRLRFGDQQSDASSFGPEILAQLAGQREQGALFGLMRRVIVRDATFVLDDRQTGRRWRADHVDAAVERAPEGYAGDLSLTVPLGGRTPEFHASYRYSSVQRTLDVALEIHAIEPAALASFAPELAPLAAANFPVSGTVVTRLNLAELKSEGLRVDLHLGKGSIKSELLPGGLLAVQEGTVRAVYAPETGELRLARLALDLGDGSAISFAGTLSGVTPAMVAGRGLRAKSIPGKLAIVLANVPVNKFESLWPPALSRGGRRWVLDNIHDGMLDEAAVQLDLDVNAATRSAEVVSAHGTMRYHDATITYLPGLTPAQKVSGTARLQDKRLIFTPTGGTVKSVHVTGGSLEISDLGAPVEWLTVDIPFAGPIQDVLETIDAKPLGYAHDIGIDPAGVAGRAEARIHFKLPLLKDLKLDQIAFAAKANLTGAGIAKVAMNRNLTDGNFALVITRPGAHLQGSSRFDGVPLNIDAHLFFKPKDGERARYRIGLTLNDEQRRRLGFDFIPDRLSGPAAIDLLYRTLDPAHARAEATVDLQSTSLSIPEAGWKKPSGAPAMARLSLDLYNERISRLREVAVKAAGLDARFAVALTPDAQQMARIDIQRFAVGNNDVSGLVTRRPQGGWYVDLRGPTLDISHWIKDLANGNSARSSGPPLQISARTDRLIFGPRRELRDVRAQLLRDGVEWQTAQIDARFTDGRQLSLRSGNQAGRRSLTFHSDDLGSALSLLAITDNVVGGRVTVTGQTSDVGGKQVFAGHIEGGDYHLVRAPVFAQILSLPSFSGVGSMLSGSGIPFSKLRGDFSFSGSHVLLDNLLTYGGAIGATANGTADLARDRLDLQGTIVPAYALNSIIGNIPLIGSLLMGGEGQGLFAANYRVTGSASDPQVWVNPLSALAPGFLRRFLQPNFGMPPPVQQSLDVQ